MVPIVSVAGITALLQEPEPELQTQALALIDRHVNQFWIELADYVSIIEMLYEDPKFPERQLAALVLSKIYFHLEQKSEALSFALGAGKLFDLAGKSEFVETIIGYCVDQYIKSQVQVHDDVLADSPREDADMLQDDHRMEDVVNRMFARCIEDKNYKQALGVAIEARRSDVIVRILEASQDSNLLDYLLTISMEYIRNIKWRNEIFEIVVQTQRKQPEPDYFAICTCLVHLNDYVAAAKDLADLTHKGGDDYLKALQIAFDLASSGTQEFLHNVQVNLPSPPDFPKIQQPTEEQDLPDQPSTQPSAAEITNLHKILSGELTIGMNLDFLYRTNKTDTVILNRIRDSLESRNSIFHNALSIANAFTHAGTTIDTFIRDNLEWLGRATNWSKFAATAALGVIHKGHLSQGRKLLEPYLPGTSGATSSAFTEGGSLYALGLIFANHGGKVSEYLLKQLQEANDEVVQHGAALGIGVAGLATADPNTMEILRNRLFNDSAVAGEACGIAMGLIMLGTGNQEAIDEMLRYARETQHEKIIRGLALGMALLMYGKENLAEPLITELLEEQEPILRFGAAYTIALAYVGTGSNLAIRRLNRIASNDPDDNVRRAAVMGIGFVLFRNHTVVPDMVKVQTESFNAHARYGAAMALGIACAGTGSVKALERLEGMLKDSTDFVRQGALIAMAMILIQQNEQSCPKVVQYRQTLEKVYSNRHEDALAKFGAAMAQGILDAGGRNVTITLQTSTGSLNMEAIVGVAMFTNFWNWFPHAHMLSLAFTPTGLIGLNGNLDIPKFDFVSNAKPSLFAYPPPTATKQAKEVEKVDTAVLSTTLKAQLRAKKTEKEKEEKEKEESGDLMDMDKPEDEAAEKMYTDEKEVEQPAPAAEEVKDKKKKKGKKDEEPQSEVLSNLSRVVPGQLKYVTFPDGSRYSPIKKPTGGVLIMKDLKPTEPDELIEMQVPIEEDTAPGLDEEAPPPSAFEYFGWDE